MATPGFFDAELSPRAWFDESSALGLADPAGLFDASLISPTRLVTATTNAVIIGTNTRSLATNAIIYFPAGPGVPSGYFAAELDPAAWFDSAGANGIGKPPGLWDDILVGPGTASRTATTSAVIQAQQTKNATTNAVIQAALTQTATTNAIVADLYTVTTSTDAVIAARQTLTASTNAVIQALVTKTFASNAIIQALQTLTGSTSAMIADRYVVAATTDAVIINAPATPGVSQAVALGLGTAFLQLMLKPAPTPQQFATLFAKAYENYARTVLPTPVLTGRRQLMEKGLLAAFNSSGGSRGTAANGVVNAFTAFWIGTPVPGGFVTSFLGAAVMKAQLMATFKGPTTTQAELAIKLARILVAATHTVQYVIGLNPPAFLV